MSNLGPFNPFLLAGVALLTALLVLLVLWLGSSRQGRRLRRLLDRSWQPVFLHPYVPASPKPGQPPR